MNAKSTLIFDFDGTLVDSELEIYKLVNTSPISKDFSLCDQIKRAASSVPANIAESYGRQTKKDRANFISYALGSVVAFLDVVKYLYPKINTTNEKEFWCSVWSTQHLATEDHWIDGVAQKELGLLLKVLKQASV